MALVKICGVKDAETAAFAAAEGADWIGFMLVPSPRRIDFNELPQVMRATGPARTVAVLVDPSDAELDRVGTYRFDVVQLHGEERPARVQEARQRTGAQVWKVVKIAKPIHLQQTRDFAVADGFLLDAAPPPDATREGGLGHSFDWSILSGWTSEKPWLLAGGLTPLNLSDALRQTHAPALDVSSGVERVRGLKDKSLIRDFIRAAKA